MDSEASSSTSSTLLPRRPKEPRNQTSKDRARHRRAHTAPQGREGSLRSRSSSSLHSCDSGESRSSSSSSQQGQRPSTGMYSCHISCRVSLDKPGYFEYLRPYSVFRAPMKRSRSIPRSFDDSYKLQHPDLSKGQQTYLCHTAAVYSMTNMKSLQERRYKQLLQHQVDIGFHTQEECDRYLKYLLGGRKHQFLADPKVWRNPPKIPVRPKSFRLPPPTKSQPPRDYRFFPRGYSDSQEGAEENRDNDEESNGEKRPEERGQGEDEGQVEGKGQMDKGQSAGSKQAEVEEPTEGQVETEDKDQAEGEANQDTNDADDDQSLSESMQGVSLYYDPQRKTTITRGQTKKEEAENDDGDGSQKSKISHQNCFWGSH